MGYAIVFIVLLAVIIVVNVVLRNSSSKKYSEDNYNNDDSEEMKLRRDLQYRNLPCNINYVHDDYSKNHNH